MEESEKNSTLAKRTKFDNSIKDLAPAGLAVSPEEWVRILKQQLLAGSKDARGVSNGDLLYFAQVCASTGLNPVNREIYAIYRGGKLTIQTGIDGLRAISERTGKYAGSDKPEFYYDENNPIKLSNGKDAPNEAAVTVKKVVGGVIVNTTRTANWVDYFPGEHLGEMWRKFPELMLSKCAEAQALRVAFPNIGQIYETSEMDQAERSSDRLGDNAAKIDRIFAEKNDKTKEPEVGQ